MLLGQDYTLDFSPHIRTKLMGYRYSIRPSEQMFTIFIFYYTYIFRASLSKEILI
jgi:hypothetical protein